MKILLYIIGVYLTFGSINSQAQWVRNDGATIVVQTRAFIVNQGSYRSESLRNMDAGIDLKGTMVLKGDLVNNATNSGILVNFDSDGTTILNGNVAQSILGSSVSTVEFENLIIKSGATLSNTTKNVVVHGDFTSLGTGYQVVVGAGNLEIVGTITGAGLFNVKCMGRLLRTPVQNELLVFPIGDGTYNQTASVLCANQPSGMQKIGVKINCDKVVTGAIKSSLDFIDITGEANLNVTLKYRLYKAALSPQTLNSNQLFRYFNGTRYVPIEQNRVTIADLGDYYEITITGLNSF